MVGKACWLVAVGAVTLIPWAAGGVSCQFYASYINPKRECNRQ